VISSYYVWKGRSVIDSKPIVLILSNVTRPSLNVKTGWEVQAWIMREDIAPHKAVSTGDNRSVCGDCPLKPKLNGDNMCYVTTHQAPLSVWKSYKKGNIPYIKPKDFVNKYGRPLRQGAYGDPAFVPYEVWEELEKSTDKIGTSYTHQWKTDFFDERMKEFSMASVESLEDKKLANAMDMRTYRMVSDVSEIEDDEIQCPNETKGTLCADCGLCSGNRKGAKNIAIVPIKSAITNNRP
tara:strand:+ start:2635 stop:3348 length:714 start_codon:yes stop_codon:yes gene_type:complete